MNSRLPRNDDKYQWTNHVVQKMRFYGLSEGRIRRVMASPKRKEEGVAPGTIALMQPAGSAKKPHEIWVMYQELKTNNNKLITNNKKTKFDMIRKRLSPSQKRIITAWRYPGVSKPRSRVPVPDEILAEILEII